MTEALAEKKCVPCRDVRFGSKADICAAKSDVRSTPNSDRESGFPKKFMSALLPKADMYAATRDVCYGPIADSGQTKRGPQCSAKPQGGPL